MNLTEPQAGSDVGALKTRAEPAGDGSYRIKGQKIFITFGDHDLADNIVHLVLARLPDAPPGTQGDLAVPRAQGAAPTARRNDVRCVSIEHKLGIHASPTCVMAFGDNDDCHRLADRRGEGGACAAMFTMMNNARLNVGLQGVSIAERATQAGGRLCAGAGPGRRARDGRAADHRASRRAPDAAADEGADPGGAGADLLYGGPGSTGRASATRPRRRGPTC